MIQSFMSYVDVVFPVSLGPLTYKCPAELARRAEPGMIVSAPLKNRITKGILWNVGSVPPAGAVKVLAEVHGGSPVLGGGLMRLLSWMADYYLAPEGTVVKQTLPKEIFAMTRKGRRPGKARFPESPLNLTAIPEEDIQELSGAIEEKKYRTFLVHAGSSIYEYSLASALLHTGLRNVLVVLPEISRADMLSGALMERFRDRVCVLHGEIAAGRRSEYMRGILAGRHDIVIGTGMALFAPMPRVSLIMVLHEHSSSYKREEGIRYNIRDTAVMRGYIEKSAVVLTSISPSIDSYFNALSRKYSLIKSGRPAGPPKTRTVDMKFEKKASPGISKTALDAARSRLGAGKRIMFVINRRGHSTLFLCAECGHTVRCPLCNIPLVLHKTERVLKCHYCGLVQNVPERCEKCGGHHLKLLGYGTQQVQEDIARLLGMEAVRFDSDKVKKDSEVAEILKNISGDSTKVIVGTRMMTRRLESEQFGLAVVLNVDASLNIPDFRASEKAYMELSSIKELLEPGGQMIIQTRFPQNAVFRYLREGDYLSFVREELAVRKSLNYPPYSRLVQITFSGSVDLARAEGTIGKTGKNVEVLGPVIDKSRKGDEQITFLLKAGDKTLLRAAAKKIKGISGTVKGLKVVIDVDPL
jgi:primosomal protein N' (replication factor Y)